MAEMKVDIKVDDTALNKLNAEIERLSKKSIDADNAILGLTGAIAGIGTAFGILVDHGQEWQDKLDEINGSQEDLMYGTKNTSEAINQMSFHLVKAVESTDVYRNAVDLLRETIDGWTSIVTGKTIEAVEREREAVKKSTKEIENNTKARKESAKVAREEAKALRAKTKAINDNVAHQKLLSKWEDAWLQKQADKANAYEAELQALDASIDAINNETDAQIANSQAKGEAIDVTNELTNSVNSQAEAHNNANDASGGSYSTTSTRSNQDQYDEATKLQLMGYNAEAEAIRDRINKEMLRELQQLNETVSGGY